MIFAESANTVIAELASSIELSNACTVVRIMVSLLLLLTQCVTPFYFAMSMSGIRRTSFMVPDGVSYTRAAVATIGIKRVTYGFISHTIQVIMVVMYMFSGEGHVSKY